YVVGSNWSNPTVPITENAGAATWCNGSGVTSGVVSASNSLTGGSPSDGVGSSISPLSNGNYVVTSSSWNDPAGQMGVGPVTWGNGAAGTTGLVTSGNSLIGSTSGDTYSTSRVLPLKNGNYVAIRPFWDNPSGA